MTERPNAVLALLLTAAAAVAVAVAVAAALVATGECEVSGIGSGVLAVVTACLFVVEHPHHVALSWLVLLLLAMASLGSFLRSLAAWWRGRRLLLRLPVERVHECPLAEIAATMGTRLYITPARRPAAFCHGLLRPRIVVTAGLLAELTFDEQTAAVWHEAHHAQRLEPLKCVLARLAAATFFWIPALHDLLERYLLAKELVADRLAAAKAGLPALAGALWVAAPTPASAVGLAEFASARIARLLDPETKLPPLFRRRRVVATAFLVVGLLVLFATPATVDLDPAHLRSLFAALAP